MRFATEATLGKLGRHLRTAGFDTLFQNQDRDPFFFDMLERERIILIRTQALLHRIGGHSLVFIRDNDPFQQMVQVVRDLGIRRSALNPLSRCLRCNLEIQPVDKETLRGRVPAYIWHHHRAFRICAGCRRIYWAGTHHDRMLEWVDRIYKQ